MADILTAAEWAADTNKIITLNQTVGGTSTSGPISLRGGAAGNGQPELYFFDITGVNPNDQFTFTTGNTGNTGSSGQQGYIGPVTWDLSAPVPEPSTTLLGTVAALSLLRRRRA